MKNQNSKQAEEALRQSNENLSKIIKTIPDASCITRLADGTFLEINQAFTDITGYTPEELLGHSSLPGGAALWTKAEDRDRMVTELKTRGEVISMEMSLRIKDQTVRTSLLSARILEINGEKCILTIAHDITERKRMEEALYSSQNMLQTVLDTIPAAVFWKDRDSNYLGGNRAWLDAVGIKSPEAVIGKSDYDLPWEQPQADSFREDDKRVIESGTAEYNIIEPFLRADGTHAWARTNKVPLRNADGKVIGVLGTYEDITERKRMEEELYKAQKLDSLGDRKSVV